MFHEARRRARVGSDQYRCRKCEKIFKLRETDVDHIKPKVDPEVGWVSCAEYAARLNCSADGLQLVCHDFCHKKKTGSENSQRRKND